MLMELTEVILRDVLVILGKNFIFVSILFIYLACAFFLFSNTFMNDYWVTLKVDSQFKPFG